MAIKRNSRRLFTSRDADRIGRSMRRGTFEQNRIGQNYDRSNAQKGSRYESSPVKGKFMSRGDRNAFSALSRMEAQNQRTNNPYYRPASREEWNRQHVSRYNDIRSAFGLNRT